MYNKIEISSQNLSYVTFFSRNNFVVSVFFRFCFWLYCALNTQHGGYVRITRLYYYFYCYILDNDNNEEGTVMDVINQDQPCRVAHMICTKPSETW